MKQWDKISAEEKVERLRKMLLLVTAMMVLLTVLTVLVAVAVIRDDDPVKPKKTERRIDYSNQAL